jgi:hypothetical protein
MAIVKINPRQDEIDEVNKERKTVKYFLKVRDRCPWKRTVGKPKPAFKCKATDLLCRPTNCALWHFIKGE